MLSFLGFLRCVHWQRQKAKRDQHVVPLKRSTLSNSRRTTGDIRTDSGVSALLAITEGKTIYRDGSVPSWNSPNCPHFPGLVYPSLSMTEAPGCCPCAQHWCPAKGSSPAPGKRGCQCAFCGKHSSVWRGRPTPESEPGGPKSPSE